MAGEHLDAVAELDEALQRVEEPFGADGRVDSEIRTRRIADEKRVAREHEPGVVGSRAVGDGERAMLGPVARRVDRAKDDGSDVDLRAVGERPAIEARARLLVHVHRNPALERESAVPRDVIGVRVRLEGGDDRHLVPSRRIQILLDRVGRVDDHRDARFLVADEVRRASEVVVDELPEQHGRDATNRCGYIS